MVEMVVQAGGGEGIQQQGSRQKAAIAAGRSSSGSPAKSKARVPARQLSFDASSTVGGTPLTPVSLSLTEGGPNSTGLS